MGNFENIDKIFPLHSVEDDMIISKIGDISLVFKVNLPPLYSLSKADILKINELFDKFIKSLPENSILQKQDFFFSGTNDEKVSNGKSFLSKSDNKFFYEKPIISHESYLTFTSRISKNLNISNLNANDFDKFKKSISSFINNIEQCISFLIKSEFFTAQRLDNDEIITLVSKYFSLSKDYSETLRDISVDNVLSVGNKLAEIYGITTNNQLPLKINPTFKKQEYSTQKTDFQVPFIQPISIGLDESHFYNQVIYIEDSKLLLNKLKLKLNQFKSLSLLSRENALIYDNIDITLTDVIEKDLTFVVQHYSLIIWGDDKHDLKRARIKVENVFRDLGIEPYQIKFDIKDIYFNNCPGASSKIAERFTFIGVSEQVPLFINFESFYGKSLNGILLADRENESPIRLDIWDEPVKKGLIVNRNRLIFGPSGTGKSFLINHIASQYFEQGHHVIMIDIGNSYKKLCNLAKGSYFAYEPSEPLEFNPFYLYEGESYNIEKKAFLTSLLIFLWKGDRSYSKEEKQIISMYLDAFYEKIKTIDSKPVINFNAFFEFLMANEITANESIYFDKISFKLSTQDFFDGKYHNILNSEIPINLTHERFIVFEMDNIKDDPILFPLVTMLCIDVIMTKIRKMPNVKKSIFIDECWKPISSGEMAEFIKYLYKTVRKFYGEVAIATQDIEDILDTVAGPAMINNTDTMILLSHKKKMAAKDKFAKYLSFNESDLEKLFSTDKREVFIKVGSTSNVYKVNVSPERYACYSSNADENMVINKTYQTYDNMELAINQFVSKKE